MAYPHLLWDLDDDPEGNVQHVARHGLTKADVMNDPEGEDQSRSSGQPIAFGRTRHGERIALVYEQIDDDTVYPITAFPVEDEDMAKRKVKHVSRGRRLTKTEAAKYNRIRASIEAERPHIQSRIRGKLAIQEVFAELKCIRQAQGKSLSDMQELTGMDRSAISKLESGKRSNPSIETLVRYADALGKRVLVEVRDIAS